MLAWQSCASLVGQRTFTDNTYTHKYILTVPIEYLLKFIMPISIPYTYLIEYHLRYLIKYLIEYPVYTIPSVSRIVYSSKILEENTLQDTPLYTSNIIFSILGNDLWNRVPFRVFQRVFCKVYVKYIMYRYKWYFIRHPVRYSRKRFTGNSIVYSIGYSIRCM